MELNRITVLVASSTSTDTRVHVISLYDTRVLTESPFITIPLPRGEDTIVLLLIALSDPDACIAVSVDKILELYTVLLSELTLQDRSLESIFDSAGKDILEMLSEQSSQEATGADETATESADDSTTAESQGEQNE